MITDDRFFSFTCIAAALVTAVVFFWSNHGVLFKARKSTSEPAPAAMTEIVASQAGDDPAPTPKNKPAITPPDVVVAINAESSDAAQRASAPIATPAPPTWMNDVVQAVLDGRDLDPGLGLVPIRNDVLVRTAEDGRTVVAAGTHRRYESVVQALDKLELDTALTMCSADAGALSGDPSDAEMRLARAIGVLLAVDEPPFEPSMESNGREWVFVDPAFRALSPAQQHLLLMGRDNARVVRRALQAISDELIGSRVAPHDTPATEIITAANDAEVETVATAP
jgi:hypothetical protein